MKPRRFGLILVSFFKGSAYLPFSMQMSLISENMRARVGAHLLKYSFIFEIIIVSG